MGLLNPTLHEAGATPGSAQHWELRSLCQAQRVAAFGPSPLQAVETFERWGKLEAAFGEGALVLALFDAQPEGVEDFEESWGAGPFLLELPLAQLDPCLFAGNAVEDMAGGWIVGPFLADWADVSVAPALFGGTARESFDGWFLVAVPSFSAALFNAGNAGVETFAGAWPALTTL
jgi:hypothetical protein